MTVAVATITLARTDQEARLIERSLAMLSAQGRPVIAADGGSDAGFVERFSCLPNCHVVHAPPGSGLLEQVKLALDQARQSGAAGILYTEPDKAAFFEHGLEEFLRAATVVPAGAVLAARTAEAQATFPPFQRYTEGVINSLCEEVTGETGDFSYGPFLMDPRLVPHVLALRENLGWGWRHFVFGLTTRLGLRLSFVARDFTCPMEQRVETPHDRLHRLKQLEENGGGLLLSQSVPLDRSDAQ